MMGRVDSLRAIAAVARAVALPSKSSPMHVLTDEREETTDDQGKRFAVWGDDPNDWEVD